MYLYHHSIIMKSRDKGMRKNSPLRISYHCMDSSTLSQFASAEACELLKETHPSCPINYVLEFCPRARSALIPHHLVISPMAQTQADPFSFLCSDTARAKRVQSYRVWELQRKLSDISSQTEAAVLEVRVIRDAAAMSCRSRYGALWVV